MDWTKLIDKFFGFLCALIPGSVVLLVAALHRPELWTMLWQVGHVGYQTQMTILLAAAFVAGTTVNSVLGGLIQGIANYVAGREAEKRAAAEAAAAKAWEAAKPAWMKEPYGVPRAGPPPTPTPEGGAPPQAPAASPPEVAYWRDPNWRNLVTAYLGKAAPENLQAYYDLAEFERALEMVDHLPAAEQSRELNRIARRSDPFHLQNNDALWREYWFRLNAVMGKANDPQVKMALILVSAYGGASILIVLAAPFTPALRHWWILLPCVYYIFVVTGSAIWNFVKSQDPAELFSQQWQYLQTHVGKGEQVSDNS
jgi:hypothetical protein